MSWIQSGFRAQLLSNLVRYLKRILSILISSFLSPFFGSLDFEMTDMIMGSHLTTPADLLFLFFLKCLFPSENYRRNCWVTQLTLMREKSAGFWTCKRKNMIPPIIVCRKKNLLIHHCKAMLKRKSFFVLLEITDRRWWIHHFLQKFRFLNGNIGEHWKRLPRSEIIDPNPVLDQFEFANFDRTIPEKIIWVL